MRKLCAGLAAAVLLVGLLPVYAFAGGSATLVMEAESGRVLYSENPHQRLPMASTTKIMTALLALEQPDIDGEFVVDSDAIRVEGSSMGLCEGDTASLRALAGGMLTASGNDAANAAAKVIAGGNKGFATLMNNRAAALGMQDTHFVTPSGLDDEQHYSTAYDMALLARAALQNPVFFEMCSAKKLSLRFGNPPYDRTLYNHNRLLSLYEPAIGIKTGFTKRSGRCLVSAARQDGVTLIVVTLNRGDDWNVHRSLYQQYFPTVSRAEVPPPEITLPVAGGQKGSVRLVQQQPLSVTVVNGEPQPTRYEIFCPYFLYTPIKKGDIAGKIVYYINKDATQEFVLLAAEDVLPLPPQPKSWWQALWERAAELLPNIGQ